MPLILFVRLLRIPWSVVRIDLDYFVLDSLANDLEAIENILAILNSDSEFGWRDQHPSPFTREEIVPALLRGIQRGDIEACVWSDRDRALVDVVRG